MYECFASTYVHQQKLEEGVSFPGLELQTVLSHHVGAGIELRSFNEQPVLLIAELSPQPFPSL